MLKTFQDYIEQHHLVEPSQVVLLAVSGGRDSVVLAHLFQASHIPFAIAHCNFHLRPGECDRDAAFVARLAEQYKVPFHLTHFQTRDYASSHHLSIEEAARMLRYDYFQQLCSDYGYHRIATGHHADDSIETFFLNLLRGTGLPGLHGILPLHDNIIRPLLPFSREQINQYVAQHQLEYVEDSSNESDEYRRNQLRHHLIPLLRQLSPNIYDSLPQTMERLYQSEQLLNHYTDQFRATLPQPQTGTLLLPGEGYVNSTQIYLLLKPYGFTSAQAMRLFAQPQIGAVFTSSSHHLYVTRQGWILTGAPADSTEDFSLPEATYHLPSEFSTFRVSPDEALFDNDKIQYPLSVRSWHPGDRFQPFGMRGSQLVSDYLTNHHFTPLQKQQLRLLVDAEDRILWLIGYRASNLCRVTDATIHIVRFQV